MTTTLVNKKKKTKENKKNERKNKKKEKKKKNYIKELTKAEKFSKKLEEDINRSEKHRYRDNEDLVYKGIRQIENLFNKIDQDYYKPIKTKSAFNNNYIEYESRGDKDKKLSVRGHLYMVMPYLENMINNHKAPIRDSNGIIKDDLSGEWKIQLTMRINFVSSLDPEKNCIMDSKSYNVKIIMSIKTEYIIEELLESFLKNYQKSLEEKMKDSDFVFESVDLLYYSLHKTTLKRGGSYIKSFKWIRNKGATINPRSTDNKCFRDATVALLNYEKYLITQKEYLILCLFFDQYIFDQYNIVSITLKRLEKVRTK